MRSQSCENSPASMGASETPAIRSVLDRPLQVVAGKGGVGRTTVSTALAVGYAKAGLRTLLLEVNAPDSAAAHLGVPPQVDEPREVLENLWLCRMTPAGALREYALMVLKFKALYALVFENKLVKYLLRSIPALAEFTMLGKTWFHTTEKRSDGSPRYERIVVDAPATGHAITFLSVARAVADIAPEGAMKAASLKMANVIESKDESCLHVVALPEEMPVNEGLEIVKAARGRLRMSPGVAFMNRVLPPLVPAGDREVFARLVARAQDDLRLRPYVFAGRMRADREAREAEYAARFASESGMPLVVLPELAQPTLDLAAIEKLASVIFGASEPSQREVEPHRPGAKAR